MVHVYTLVLVAAIGVGLPQPSRAQDAPSQPAPNQAAPAAQQIVTSADVPDTELEQFAKSVEQVAVIRQEVDKQLESVSDSENVQRVKTEGNEKMAAAIKGNGLDVERFNLIARSINVDPELKERYQQKVLELRQQPA
jgi:hypothetical protein